MKQSTSLTGVIEEIKELKIEVIALRVVLNALKDAVVQADPHVADAIKAAKDQLVKNLPSDTDAASQLRERTIQLLHAW